MKLQLEFTHVDHAAKRVTLKPINCALTGELIYNLPNRAAEMCKVGDVVEASIPLPDQYPVCDLPQPNRGDWQYPIRTAQKDGSVIFLLTRNPENAVCARWESNRWVDERGNALAGEPIYWKYPSAHPAGHLYPCYDPAALETRTVDGKWFKRDDFDPGVHYWVPIQCEIDKAIEQARLDGQPHVIPRCGYVSNYGEFIPYKRVGDCAA